MPPPPSVTQPRPQTPARTPAHLHARHLCACVHARTHIRARTRARACARAPSRRHLPGGLTLPKRPAMLEKGPVVGNGGPPPPEEVTPALLSEPGNRSCLSMLRRGEPHGHLAVPVTARSRGPGRRACAPTCRNCKIRDLCCFKAFSCGDMCHTAADN